MDLEGEGEVGPEEEAAGAKRFDELQRVRAHVLTFFFKIIIIDY